MTRQDLDPADLGIGIYPWLNSVVVPRPIAWVSTRSATGVDNLAPHSFFTVAGIDPPVVSFTSVGEKDTLRNVRATREFVVCMSTERLAEQVNASATDFPGEVSEFDAVGVTREPSLRVGPPRVAQSPVAIECRYVDERTFGSCTVVFGQVVHLAVDTEVLEEGRPEIRLLQPVSRLGANEWATVGEITDRRRVPFSELSA